MLLQILLHSSLLLAISATSKSEISVGLPPMLDGYYYATKLEWNGAELHVLKSKSLTNWATAQKSLVFNTTGQSGAYMVEPRIYFIDRNFYIYFGLSSMTHSYQIYVISARDAANPLGKWTSNPVRLTNDEEVYAESGIVFTYPNGQLYLIWTGKKTWGSDSGLYITNLCGPMTRCKESHLLAKGNQTWDERALYSPQIGQRKGSTFLTYMAYSSDTTEKGVGLLRIDGQKDPLLSTNWFRSTVSVFDPNESEGIQQVGSPSFTYSPDGTESWILYHVFNNLSFGYSPRAQRMTWNAADDSPIFPKPASLSTELLIPSETN